MESLIEEYDTERVPNDWELKQLGEIADIVGGGTPSTFIPEYWNGDINWFTPTEIGLSKYSFESSRKITRKGLENSSAKVLPEGAILLTSRAAIGDVSILMKEGCTNQGFQSLIAKKGVNNEYLYYLVSTLKRIFLQNASGSTFLEISPKKVKSVIVSVPQSQEEQIAIATALSDTDALIENLEKLIAKKRNIKQGVMQELLTGRKRLAGFNGEWGIRKLGDLAEMYSGGTPLTTNDSFYNGDIPWVVIADMTKSGKYIYKTEKTITETGLQNSSAKLFKKGVILFAMYASIGKCTIAQMDTACNQAILGISTKLIDTEFLYYYLSYNESKFIRMGQTGTQSNLNKEIVQELKIPFPQRNEQIEIAGFLSSIDNEIDGLEQKLRKSQMIKQGMMQSLLTGKIRLV